MVSVSYVKKAIILFVSGLRIRMPSSTVLTVSTLHLVLNKLETWELVLTELKSIKDECIKLKEENVELKRLLQSCSINSNAAIQKTGSSPIEIKEHKHLVLTASVLRDIDDTTEARVEKFTEKLNLYHGQSFDSITYHIATHDLASIKDEPDNMTDILDEYKVLISNAKALTDSVIVSSVCSRLDDVSQLVDQHSTWL